MTSLKWYEKAAKAVGVSLIEASVIDTVSVSEYGAKSVLVACSNQQTRFKIGKDGSLSEAPKGSKARSLVMFDHNQADKSPARKGIAREKVWYVIIGIEPTGIVARTRKDAIDTWKRVAHKHGSLVLGQKKPLPLAIHNGF